MTEPKTSGNGFISPMDPEKMHDRTAGGLISRQAAIDILRKMPVLEFKKTDDGLIDALISIGQVYMALTQLPSAQSNQTICRDCRWLRPNAGTGYCTVWHRETEPAGYCHKGAGRDGTRRR